MILGYSTNAYTNMTLLESFEHIAALGFRGVEIMCDRPHLYPPDFREDKLAEVKATLDRCGLRVTNLNSFTLFAVGDTYLPSWIEPEAERRQMRVAHTLDCLNIAKALGSGCISIPPGGPLPPGMSRKKALALFYQGIDRVAPEAERLGIRLLVEPEPKLLLERTGEFVEFIVDVKSPAVGINFDIGHFFCAGEDPAHSAETLIEWIGHVHLEDIGTDRRHHHLIPGLGAIDFESVFTAFQRLGYDGDISLELYTYADRPDDAGRQSREFLAPIFEKSGFTGL